MQDNKQNNQDSKQLLTNTKLSNKPYYRTSTKGRKIDKDAVSDRLNGLGRYIESLDDWDYTKVAHHLGVKRQAIWAKSHNPRKIENLTLGTLWDLSTVFNEHLTDFIKKIIELDN